MSQRPPEPSVLALETSTERCSVALARAHRIAVRREDVGQGHSERLIPMVSELLKEEGVALRECAAIAFGAGPGSFTGLRIACAVAQGLALGAGLKLIAIDSLSVIAEAGFEKHAFADGSTVLAAQDARMGEVYFGVYRRVHEGWDTLVAPALARPEAILAEWPEPVDFGAGNAFSVFADRLSVRPLSSDSNLSPDAAAIAALGLRAWHAGNAVAPELAAPLYVRDRVAMTVEERRAAKAESV